MTEPDVDAWIREHGVTRCPTAAAAVTSATITPEARAAHAARGLDPVGESWRKGKRVFGWALYWRKRKAEGR